jgi:hypothetical protein
MTPVLVLIECLTFKGLNRSLAELDCPICEMFATECFAAGRRLSADFLV